MPSKLLLMQDRPETSVLECLVSFYCNVLDMYGCGCHHHTPLGYDLEAWVVLTWSECVVPTCSSSHRSFLTVSISKQYIYRGIIPGKHVFVCLIDSKGTCGQQITTSHIRCMTHCSDTHTHANRHMPRSKRIQIYLWFSIFCKQQRHEIFKSEKRGRSLNTR